MIEFGTGFIGLLFFEVVVLAVLRYFLFFTIVKESTCQVFTLFGNVDLVIREPGLHFLWGRLTWKAFVMRSLGRIYTLDLRMDQNYLRSQPVNSEEGAPMGVGIWYEMKMIDPVSYLFKNTDPSGSLLANVSNAAVRTLSNRSLASLLEDRHSLSLAVRQEVTAKSREWGYELGSVYIRKVHFNDQKMIREIEAKVVNRLRQVTAAISQDGDNQVRIIKSSAQKEAAFEFAKAQAIRPEIVGTALKEISRDPEVAEALFEVLEAQKMLESEAEIILVPGKGSLGTLIQSV